MRRVELEPAPEVQVLGDAAVVKGAAALDAYRLLAEGIAVVRRRDGIEPNERLLQTVAALKIAASSVSPNTTNVRSRTTSRELIRTGEVIGIEEAARMYGCDTWKARRLASSWGGHRGKGRGRPWQFDRGLVQAYIDAEESA